MLITKIYFAFLYCVNHLKLCNQYCPEMGIDRMLFLALNFSVKIFFDLGKTIKSSGQYFRRKHCSSPVYLLVPYGNLLSNYNATTRNENASSVYGCTDATQ